VHTLAMRATIVNGQRPGFPFRPAALLLRRCLTGPGEKRR